MNGTYTEVTRFVNLETNNCWFDKLLTDNCESTRLNTGKSSSIRLDIEDHRLHQILYRRPQKYPSDRHKLGSHQFDKDNTGCMQRDTDDHESIGLGTDDL